jgi:CHASE3 domain sensor protein
MTPEQLQQAIDKEEKVLTEFLERANQEATFRRGRIAALKDMHATTQEAQLTDEGDG